MTNFPDWNFALFDRARDALTAKGWEVVSPADLDRADGFDPILHPEEVPLPYEACMERDRAAMETCVAAHFLPGWQASNGANREMEYALELGLDLYRCWWTGAAFHEEPMPNPNHKHTFVEPAMPHALEDSGTRRAAIEQEIEAKLDNPKESILLTAYNLVYGKREKDYGHPLEDFTRTGRMWGAIMDLPGYVPPEKVALCMMAVKMSRLCHTPGHRDSVVDIAGYAATYDRLTEDDE